MPSKQMVTIYALKDPETRQIRYIGQTAFPDKRLRQHLRETSRCYRVHWISELKSRGLIPKFEALVTVPTAEANDWEIKFIFTARKLGFSLVNGTDGGDGAKNPSAETREKIAKAKRGPLNPNYGVVFSEERRANMSAAQLGKKMPPCSEEHRRNMGLAKKGMVHSLESRAKMSASRLGKSRGPYQLSPESRQKLRENGKASHQKMSARRAAVQAATT